MLASAACPPNVEPHRAMLGEREPDNITEAERDARERASWAAEAVRAALEAGRLAYADDLTFWALCDGDLQLMWPILAAALCKAGFEVNLKKCTATRLGRPAGPGWPPIVKGIAEDTGLVVLGNDLADGVAARNGSPMRRILGEEEDIGQQGDPTAERGSKARQLAKAIEAMVAAGDVEYGVHAGFVLLHRVACPALDCDMRVRSGASNRA